MSKPSKMRQEVFGGQYYIVNDEGKVLGASMDGWCALWAAARGVIVSSDHMGVQPFAHVSFFIPSLDITPF